MLVIVLIVVIGLLAVVMVWGTKNSVPANAEVGTLESPVSMLYRCSQFSCSSGYSCDSIYQVCKKDNGERCDNASDCLNGSFCSGLCVTGTAGVESGLPFDPCPCGPSMTCVTEASGLKTCRLNAGQPCSDDGQCFSELCMNGTCSDGLPLGSVCSSNNDCAGTAHCSLGYCQRVGINTGDPGAVCNSLFTPGCNVGNACVNDLCVVASSGLFNSCNNLGQTCSLPQACLDSDNYSVCATGSVTCSCFYEFSLFLGSYRPDPNSCNGNVCSLGSVCSSGRCLGQADYPCVSNSQCLSGRCLSPPLLSRANFGGGGQLPDSIIGSTVMGWNAISFIGPSTVDSLTGYTSTQDQIFFVSKGDSSDPFSGLTLFSGSNIIPGVSTSGGSTRRLISAIVLSPTVGFVIFNETTSSQEARTLYTFNFTTGSLNPFNVSSGIPGTQYFDGTPIKMERVSYSSASDVLIWDGTYIYILQGSAGAYSRLTSSLDGTTVITGSLNPAFYFDGSSLSSGLPCIAGCPAFANVAYISQYSSNATGTTIDFGKVLIFNGNSLGLIVPVFQFVSSGGVVSVDKYTAYDFSIYSNPSTGLNEGYIAVIATNEVTNITNVFVRTILGTVALPGYASPSSRVLALSSGLYLFTPGLCSA